MGKAAVRASRPDMPDYNLLDAGAGRGLLPWSWVEERLTRARTYWIATTRPDGRPHVMPVWGVWLRDRLIFSTGKRSRKARNLAHNPHCAAAVELGEEAISMEGEAVLVEDLSIIQEFATIYSSKYAWDMSGFSEPIYVFRPKVVFAFVSSPGEFTGSATRWTFDAS